MTKRRRRKSTKTKAKSTKRMTDLNRLKATQSELFSRVQENYAIIMKQTGVDAEELSGHVQKYGYEAISTLDGFEIAEPIYEQMMKTFKLYDKVADLVDRLERAENKLFVTELERKTLELETKVKQLEEEESFYTDPINKEGMVKMKEKYYIEKEHWEIKKAEALAKLEGDQKTSPELELAKTQLKVLSKKRWWARGRNIMPSVTKIMGKVSKGVNEISKGVGQIGDEFGRVGGGMSTGQSTKNFADDWTTEKIFGDYKPPKVGGKGKKEKSSGSGFMDGIDPSW